jgi:hypothetical protein
VRGRGRLPGDAELEALRRVAGEGAGHVFKKVGRAAAIEIAIARDEADLPAVGARQAAGLEELPLLPGIRQPVAVGISAQVEVEADAFAAVAGAQRAADLDGVELAAVHLDREGEHSLGGHGGVGVDPGAGAVLVDADGELVVAAGGHLGRDGRAGDFDIVAQQHDDGAFYREGGADLIADDAMKRVMGRRWEGSERDASQS